MVTQRGKKGSSKSVGKIDSELSEETFYVQLICMLPLVNVIGNNDTLSPSYSIHKLLGVISDILNKFDFTKGNSGTRNKMLGTLITKAQRSEFNIPKWYMNSGEIHTDDDESVIFNESDFIKTKDTEEVEQLNTILDNIIKWKNEFSNDTSTHSVLLSRIFTRFYYGLKRLSFELEENLGIIFHRMVILFLNSVLVEEAREKHELHEFYLSLNNPSTSDNLFIINLNKVANSKELAFSKWMFSCPLLTCFLNLQEETKAKYRQFTENSSNLDFSVYDTLSSVFVKTDQMTYKEKLLLNNIEAKHNYVPDINKKRVRVVQKMARARLSSMNESMDAEKSFRSTDQKAITYFKQYLKYKDIRIEGFYKMNDEAIKELFKTMQDDELFKYTISRSTPLIKIRDKKLLG